jgi:hypothetical protein
VSCGVLYTTASWSVVFALDAKTGRHLWPTIAGGMLYTTSGYGTFGQMPGNVLLAFGAELIVDAPAPLLA